MAASSACMHTGDWQTCYQKKPVSFSTPERAVKDCQKLSLRAPSYLRPPLLIRISQEKKGFPSMIAPSGRQKKGVYFLGHNLVFQAANVNSVDSDWLESGGVHPEPLLRPLVILQVSFSLLAISLLPAEASIDRVPPQSGGIKAKKLMI